MAMMVSRAFLIAAPVLFAALRAKREATPAYEISIGPARIIRTRTSEPAYQVDIGTARIHQTPPPRGAGDGEPTADPMRVTFLVRVSGLEKLGVSATDVKNAVLARASVLPGVGKPTVGVADVSGGYRVVARYPDSSGSISNAEAKRRIEAIDPRLSGRVSSVQVSHA